MNKNIVIICFKYPPEYSGYGKQLKSVLTHIIKSDKSFNFTILTAFKSSKVEESDNIKIVPLSSNMHSKGLLFYTFCMKVLIWLIANNKKYTLIHCIKAGPEAIVANMISKLFKKKLLVKVAQDELSDRELENTNLIKKVNRASRHLMLSKVDNFVAISEEIAESVCKKVNKNTNILRIPNGVDVNKFYPVTNQLKLDIRSKLNLPLNEVIILFAGAINRRKGVLEILNSIDSLGSVKKSTFVMCGPILEKDINFEYKVTKINESRKNINIVYKGKVNNIDEYMRAADLFLLPSYSEGLPNVLLEAAASGLPLIATDIGGSRDIVNEGVNGFLVPTGSAHALASKMNQLINNDELREKMGMNAKKVINEKFALERISYMYIQLYEKLLINNKYGA